MEGSKAAQKVQSVTTCSNMLQSVTKCSKIEKGTGIHTILVPFSITGGKMTNKLLRAKEIQAAMGVSRQALLRWEDEGKLSGVVSRTPGGQRRYNAEALQNIMMIDDNGSGDSDIESIKKMPKYTELGSTGVKDWRTSGYTERLKELQGRKGIILRREMRLNDPVIAAVFFGINNTMRQAGFRIKAASEKPADRKAAEFVEQCFHDMSWSWADQSTFIFEPTLEQGFSALELVYKKRLGDEPNLPYLSNPARSKYDDGLIGWRKMSPRPALSLMEGNEFEFDENGGITGINQSVDQIYKQQFIPIEKLLHFRTTVHPANNPFGISIHRAAYTAWWYSMNIQEIEGIGIERDLAGIPIVYLGNGTTKSGVHSDFALAKNLVVNLRNDEQAGIVIPHQKMGADGKGMLVELLSTDSRRQYNTNEILNRYDKRKAMTVMAQFLMLGMEKVGSYALSRHQGDLFAIAVGAWLNSFADILNRHAIEKLIKFNAQAFPGITGMPEYVPGIVGVPNLDVISEFVNKLVDKQVLTPDAELERHMRQLGGLPQSSINLSAEDRMENKNEGKNSDDESEAVIDEKEEKEIEDKGEEKENDNTSE